MMNEYLTLREAGELVIQKMLDDAVATEREECARIADKLAAELDGMTGEQATAEGIAERIRARGGK